MAPATTAPERVSPARQRILETAFRLFYARGVRAVGVDTIIAESGVAKATFYRHFPAKDDLVLAYLGRVDPVWPGQLRRAAAAAGAGRAGLCHALVATGRRVGSRGCAFNTAAAEGGRGGAAHDRTIAHKQSVLAWVQQLATEAGAADPARLARRLTMLLDGALSAGALDADPEAALAARDTARMLVTEAVRR